MDLLARRKAAGFGWLEAAVLGLYAALVGWLTCFHEPWADEAQSWLIARDSSLGEIFFKRLHYEGTPGLWHLFLWLCARLHLSYTAMHWATASIGVGAVYVLLRYAPFPTVVRVMLPFSIALAYQTSIVARSYSFVPILVFLICIEITAGRRRPFLFALWTGLLANTALIGFLLAVSLVPLYLLKPYARIASVEAKRLWKPAVLLAGFLLFAIYTAVPAPDCSFGRAVGLTSRPAIARVLSAITRIPLPRPGPVQASGVVPETLPPTPPYAYQRMLIQLDRHFAPNSRGDILVRAGVSLASTAFFPISSSNLLALLFYGVLIAWLWRQKSLVYLLPSGVVLCGGYLIGFNEQHTSVLWAALSACLWMAWAGMPPGERTKLDSAFVLVLAVVLLEQIAWTGFAAVYDTRSAFDGSVAAAKFLEPLEGRYTVFGYGPFSVSVQPYAEHNVYGNQRSTYWPWSSLVDPDHEITRTLEQRPAYVLVGESYFGDVLLTNQIVPRAAPWTKVESDRLASYLIAHGYRETHRFCGMQPMHFGFSMKICEVIYEPDPK